MKSRFSKFPKEARNGKASPVSERSEKSKASIFFLAPTAFLGLLVAIFGICAKNCAQWWYREPLASSLGLFSEGRQKVLEFCSKSLTPKRAREPRFFAPDGGSEAAGRITDHKLSDPCPREGPTRAWEGSYEGQNRRNFDLFRASHSHP